MDMGLVLPRNRRVTRRVLDDAALQRKNGIVWTFRFPYLRVGGAVYTHERLPFITYEKITRVEILPHNMLRDSATYFYGVVDDVSRAWRHTYRHTLETLMIYPCLTQAIIGAEAGVSQHSLNLGHR